MKEAAPFDRNSFFPDTTITFRYKKSALF